MTGGSYNSWLTLIWPHQRRPIKLIQAIFYRTCVEMRILILNNHCLLFLPWARPLLNLLLSDVGMSANVLPSQSCVRTWSSEVSRMCLHQATFLFHSFTNIRQVGYLALREDCTSQNIWRLAEFLSELPGNFQIKWTWILRWIYLMKGINRWTRLVTSRLLAFTDH